MLLSKIMAKFRFPFLRIFQSMTYQISYHLLKNLDFSNINTQNPLTLNQQVAGSSPAGCTKIGSKPAKF